MKVFIDGSNISEKTAKKLFVNNVEWNTPVELGSKLGIVYYFVTPLTTHVRTDNENNKEALQLIKDLNDPLVLSITYDYVIELKNNTTKKDLLRTLDVIFWEAYKKLMSSFVAIDDKNMDEIMTKLKSGELNLQDFLNKCQKEEKK